MQTVRFTQVVKKCGKPQVYLLLSNDDKEFRHALKANRIMSLVGGIEGAKTEYGLVGYDEKRRGQLLLFPRSLKPFAESRVVGIKFDLLKEDYGSKKVKATKTPAALTKSLPKEKNEIANRKKEKRPAPALESKNVIPFPPVEKKPEEIDLDELKRLAREALRALEKNNSVAAYNLLKRVAE